MRKFYADQKTARLTRRLLPRDLRLGKPVGLAVHLGVAALGKLLVRGLNSPAGGD